jgi:secretion/DNA translocation related CpaE-like protein
MTVALLATRDPALHDELTRLAAGAGAEVVTTAEAVDALRAWPSAALVLVGADVAEEVAVLGPPRRPRVHVLALAVASDTTFRVALALGAEQVLELPRDAGRVSTLLSDLGDERTSPGLVVGVVGGSGGAGATTFACALGQVAARAGPALVVDCDPLGPGVDRVLGLDATPGVRWEDLDRTSGHLGARSFREALPGREGLRVLTWSAGSVSVPAPATVRESLSAARRGHDVVVVDLPRAVDPVSEETVARCDAVLVVLRPTVASVAAAARLVGRLPDPGRLGLVARGTGVDPADLTAVTGVPVLADMGDQRRLAESVDVGLGPARARRGPLARAAAQVLGQLSAPVSG